MIFHYIVNLLLSLLQFGISKTNKKPGVLGFIPAIQAISGIIYGVIIYNTVRQPGYPLESSIDAYVITAIAPYLICFIISLLILIMSNKERKKANKEAGIN